MFNKVLSTQSAAGRASPGSGARLREALPRLPGASAGGRSLRVTGGTLGAWILSVLMTHPPNPRGPPWPHFLPASGRLALGGPGKRGHPIHPRLRPPITASRWVASAEGRARGVTPGHWPGRPPANLREPGEPAQQAGLGWCSPARSAGSGSL